MLVTLQIPYAAEHPRTVAKKSGYKWNPTSKVWTKEVKSLDEVGWKLVPYIVKDVVVSSVVPVSKNRGYANDDDFDCMGNRW